MAALAVGLALFAAAAASTANDEPGPTMQVVRGEDGVHVDGEGSAIPAADLEALVMTLDSGGADVYASAIRVRGVTADRTAWEAALDRLRGTLPAGLVLDTDVHVVDSPKPTALLCRELFAASTRQPIRFQQSGATIRTSSHAALDRLVEFAADCPGTAIRITGHSDSMGDPAFNLDLSERRARSVADYLVERGVDRDRLLVVGAGASQPVADNATSYGRRQNRRIEFTLATPPAD
jgi:outer membrane protein OmpA-like peptidoglycan-associated protein